MATKANEAVPPTQANPFQLLSLPPSLLLAITEKAQARDVGNLRLSCRQLSKLLQSQTYRRLQIYLTPALIHSSLFKLRWLAAGTSPGCKWTKHLELGPLNNLYTPLQPGYAQALRNAYPSERQYLDLVQEALQLLPIAIISLEALQSFRWDLCGFGMPTTSETDDLVEILARLPTLRSLEVRLRSNQAPPPFHKLQALRHASFIILPPRDAASRCQVSPEVARLTASAPSLLSISVHDELLPLDNPRSLNDIIDATSTTPTTIRRLHIGGSGFSILSPLGGAFAHLKSLTISQDGEHALTSADKVIEGLEEFWRQWNEYTSGIFLEELNISHVPPPSLIEYLCSYTGLRQLRISSSVRGWVQVDPVRFWDDVLAKHSATLHVLQVQVDHKNLAYASHRGLIACRALRELTVSIALPLYDSVHDGEAASTIGVHLAQLLKDSIQSLPWLQKAVVAMPATRKPRQHKGPKTPHTDWTRVEAKSVVQRCLGISGPRRIFLCRFDATRAGIESDMLLRILESNCATQSNAPQLN